LTLEDHAGKMKTISDSLKALGDEIAAMSAAADLVSDKFHIIDSYTDEVNEMSARITEALREQEGGSREVLTAVRDIDTATVRVKDNSTQMFDGSRYTNLKLRQEIEGEVPMYGLVVKKEVAEKQIAEDERKRAGESEPLSTASSTNGEREDRTGEEKLENPATTKSITSESPQNRHFSIRMFSLQALNHAEAPPS